MTIGRFKRFVTDFSKLPAENSPVITEQVSLICPDVITDDGIMLEIVDDAGVAGRYYKFVIDNVVIGTIDYPETVFTSSVPIAAGDRTITLFSNTNQDEDPGVFVEEIVDVCDVVVTPSNTAPVTLPFLTSHVDGAVLAGTSDTFIFDDGGNVLEGLNINIGSTGSNTTNEYGNLASFNDGSPRQIQTDQLPDNGEPVYLTIDYKIGGVWNRVTYLFTAFTDVTIDPPTVAGDWDNNRKWGGRIYGNPYSGFSTGNAPLRREHLRVFMAPRSGISTGMIHHNRLLLDGDIERRAASRGGIWQKVFDAVGADALRGGIMLPNSYSAGNGGLLTVHLYEIGSDGFPTGPELARTAQFVPFDLARDNVVLPWLSSASITGGKLYGHHYTNARPPSKYRNASASEAQNQDITTGAIALDGVQHHAPYTQDRFGPFIRRFDACYTRSGITGEWAYNNVTSLYGMIFDDGNNFGDLTPRLYSKGDYKYKAEGNNRIRENFVFPYAATAFDRITVRMGIDKNQSNTSPLQFELKDSNQAVLATAQFAPDSELATNANNDSSSIKNRTKSFTANLSQVVTLNSGQRYFGEFHSPNGTEYEFCQCLPHDDGGLIGKAWPEGDAEYSTDGGNTWDDVDVWKGSNWTFNFIPVGMPTLTPKP